MKRIVSEDVLGGEKRALQNYVAFLEEKYVVELQHKCNDLCKDLHANAKNVHFVSEKDVVKFTSGRDNKRKKVEKIVKGQLEQYNNIISSIKDFKKVDGCPFGEDLQIAIFETSCKLLDPAIKLGYCKQASELIRIAKNPRLVGKDLAAANVDDKLLRVADAYGKRSILEGGQNDDEITEALNDMVLGVKKGKYGDCTLSQDKIENAYRNATAKIGDTIIRMDGSHYIDNASDGRGGK